MEGNYERILEKIASSASLGKEEVERQIEAKRAKLSGLISKEGAAQVVASELGVSFDNEHLKIDELLPSMRKFNTSGKFIFISPVRSFKTKKGIESKVVNLTLADETSNIRVVLWDTNHVGLVEKGEITENTSIELDNGSMRGQEVHLGSFSELKVIDKVFENVKTEKVVHEKQVSDLNIGESSSVRAFVVQAFEPNFFSICPECNKKVVQEGEGFLCKEHGKVAPEKRAVTNVVVDDGTGSIRAVLFHEKISELGINIESENLTQEKEKIMGKEMIFSGNVRNNAFFNTPELIIDSVKPVDLDKVIETLEKNAN
jgi:ssDNA-binding replication factor A large subunit